MVESATKVECNNSDCRFDFATLAMDVPYARPKGPGGAVEDNVIHCPICGTPQPGLLRNRGIFRPANSSEWVQWKHVKGEQRSVDITGAFRVKIPDALPVKVKDFTEICFPKVPCFESGPRREPVVPVLPVQPEYLSWLDPKTLRELRAGRWSSGAYANRSTKKYQCSLPLQGVEAKDWPVVTLDLYPANEPREGLDPLEGVAFSGLSLKVWPNLKRPYLGWRYYLLSVSALDERGLNELNARGLRRLAVRALVPLLEEREGHEEESEHAFEPLSVLSREAPLSKERASITVASAGDERSNEKPPRRWCGRPAWVTVEFFDDANTRVAGGGLFSLAPADTTVRPSGDWTFGLDFGTSNTVMAHAPPGAIAEPETLKARADSTLWLIDRGDTELGGDLGIWPGQEWLGESKDLLPSELVAREGWGYYLTRQSEIGALPFGVALGVPLAGRAKRYGADQVLGEFKWRRAIERGELTRLSQSVQTLQARFLEFAVLMAVASKLSQTDYVPATINIRYSYPTAFLDEDHETLGLASSGYKPTQNQGEEDNRARDCATVRLRSLLAGTSVEFKKHRDEAAAAAMFGRPNSQFRVFVDIGGGSLEVLVEDSFARSGHANHAGLDGTVTSTSMYFGGGVYLRALVEGGCSGGLNSAQFGARVRALRSGQDMVESSGPVPTAHVKAAERRSKIYTGYIAEFVARTLAGVCFEYGFEAAEPTPQGAAQNDVFARRWNLTRNRLFTFDTTRKRWILGQNDPGSQGRKVEFELVLLGKGWGCAEVGIARGNIIDHVFALIVQTRLREILKHHADVASRISDGEFSLAHPGVSVRVTSSNPADPAKLHRKALVACGLLKEGKDLKEMSSTRHGVLGFDLWIDNARKIEWYRSFGKPAQSTSPYLDGGNVRIPPGHAEAERLMASSPSVQPPWAQRGPVSSPYAQPAFPGPQGFQQPFPQQPQQAIYPYPQPPPVAQHPQQLYFQQPFPQQGPSPAGFSSHPQPPTGYPPQHASAPPQATQGYQHHGHPSPQSFPQPGGYGPPMGAPQGWPQPPSSGAPPQGWSQPPSSGAPPQGWPQPPQGPQSIAMSVILSDGRTVPCTTHAMAAEVILGVLPQGLPGDVALGVALMTRVDVPGRGPVPAFQLPELDALIRGRIR